MTRHVYLSIVVSVSWQCTNLVKHVSLVSCSSCDIAGSCSVVLTQQLLNYVIYIFVCSLWWNYCLWFNFFYNCFAFQRLLYTCISSCIRKLHKSYLNAKMYHMTLLNNILYALRRLRLNNRTRFDIVNLLRILVYSLLGKFHL